MKLVSKSDSNKGHLEALQMLRGGGDEYCSVAGSDALFVFVIEAKSRRWRTRLVGEG